MATPKLRFKEFDGGWSNKKIGEIAVVTSGGTPSRNIPKYWNGHIPWVTTSLVDFNIINNAEEFITQDGVDNSSAKLFPKNTILMAMYGQGITRGKVAILGIDATTNQACAAIKLRDGIDIHFVFQNLMNRYEEIRDLSNEGGQKNLSAGIIKDISISYPSKPEQTKIASFLSAVDEKISQLTQKHALLSQYKQGMMQKLFSQQIRFKADDGSEFGEWINYKIFNLAKDKTLNNGVFNDQNKVGKGYKLINVLDMYIQRDIDESRLSLLDLDKKEFENNKVNYGDIFFTRSSLVKEGIAFSNVYLGVSDDITYDGHLIKLSPDLNMVEPKFLNYCLKIAYVRKQLIQGGKTATMTTIGQKEVGNTIVKVPCLEEQTKIANFLSSIDQKIEVVAQQIEQARTWKKGLLQQMFV